MPFTVSHAAAVMPLSRNRSFVLSALVIGSMVPDLEFYLFFSFTRVVSHSLLGIFTFCLPAGLIALAVFHGLLKRPLLSLLPIGHRRLLAPYAGSFAWRPASRFLQIVVSLLVGVLSHLVWDAFTHVYGLGVRAFPLLALPLWPLSRGAIRICDLLQLFFSIMGLVFLLHAYFDWYGRQPGPPTHILDHVPELWQLLVLGAFLLTALGLGAGYGFSVPVVLTDVISLREFGGRVVSAGAAVAMAQAIAFSMAHVGFRRQREVDY